MFRRPVLVNVHAPQRTEYVTREVIEKRAPTDDSVKLLKEMEEKAIDKVVATIRVSDTEVECVILVTRLEYAAQTQARVVFSLSGRQMREDVVLKDGATRSENLTMVRDAISRRIANEIIGPALDRIDMKLWPRIGT